MSMYAEYVKERCDRNSFEIDGVGFITYEIAGKECFIHDAYVGIEHRRGGEAARMLAAVVAIAKEQGCSSLACTVCPAANRSTEALKAVLACGFKLRQSVVNLISFEKGI